MGELPFLSSSIEAAWRVAVQRAVELLRESDAEPTDAGHALLDGMELAARTWSEENAQSDHHELEWARKEVERHVREVGLGTQPEPAYMIGVLGAHRDC
jgi:hypothetical protein